MNCEVLAVGTELLLGSNDTNSAWIGSKLAEAGIDSFVHTVAGDNVDRIVAAVSAALERSDALIVTGGLGPTRDDVTRVAIARVMKTELERDDQMLGNIERIFRSRNREMAPSNAQQADRPVGAEFIEQRLGTAPGLICPVDKKVIYALPGVPREMHDMMIRAVLPDLSCRAGTESVLLSRFVKAWGTSEAAIGEMLVPQIERLDSGDGKATVAFLAKGIEGIHVRITARGQDAEEAKAVLDAEESVVRSVLGPLVFGVDDETMELAVGNLLLAGGMTLAVAESLTGGLIASRLTLVPGASKWMLGGVVSYASEVKYSVLDVPRGPVVTAAAARAMAEGVRGALGSTVGIAVTGVAGPDEQEGQPVGTVHGAVAMPGAETRSYEWRFSGDRSAIREMSCINLLDGLRRQLTGV